LAANETGSNWVDEGAGRARRIIGIGHESAAPQAVVDEVDQVGQRDRQHQVEEPGGDQRRQIAGLRVEVPAHLEQLTLAGDQAKEVHQRRRLQQRDELVDQRGQHSPHALGDDHQLHGRRVVEAQCARRFHLAGLNALDAGPEDLADVGARHQPEGGDAEGVGVVAGQ
jgi:hypothetical protein